MLREVLLELALEVVLVPDKLLAVRGREVDGVLVRNIDAGNGDGPVVVHLLRELSGEFHGLHVRAKGPAEDPLEKGLDLVFECAEDHVPGDTRRSMLTNGYNETGGPHGHHERDRGNARDDQQRRSQEGGAARGGGRPREKAVPAGRTPATIREVRTAAAAGGGGGIGERTPTVGRGSRPRAEGGASNGPREKSSPVRGSRHESARTTIA